jgi:hypothetical protein
MARSLRPRRPQAAVVAVLLTVLSTFAGNPCRARHGHDPRALRGQFHRDLRPPLTNTPRLTDVTFPQRAKFLPVRRRHQRRCLGQVQCHPQLHHTGPAPHPATTTFSWNSGASSTIAFSLSTVDRLVNGTTVVTSYGTVTHGFDQGAQAIHTAVQPQLDLIACAGAGVARLTGPEVLQLM